MLPFLGRASDNLCTQHVIFDFSTVMVLGFLNTYMYAADFIFLGMLLEVLYVYM